MERELDKFKAEPRPITRKLAQRFRIIFGRVDLFSAALYLIGYGGIGAVAILIVLAIPQAREAPPTPEPAPAQAVVKAPPISEEPPIEDGAPPSEGREIRHEPEAPPAPDTDAALREDPPAPPSGGVIVGGAREALAPPKPVTPRKSPPEAEPEPEDDAGEGCRFYPVLPGDSTPVVARRLQTTPAELRTWNPEIVEEGPQAVANLRVCTGERVIVEWREREIRVNPGDSLLALARKHGLSLENIVERNGIDPDRIQVGQSLIIQEPVWE